MNNIKNSQEGFVLIAAMLLLLILTIMGAMATRTSVIELHIAGNERRATGDFYVADSSWQIGGVWVDNRVSAPDLVNINTKNGSDNIIRNYGGGNDDVLNNNFTAGTEDGIFANTAYWYRILYVNDEKVEGENDSYANFVLDIDGTTSVTGVKARVTKVYKVGY